MKKILLLMAIVLPLVFVSCDQNEPVILDESEFVDDYVDLGLPSGTLWATRNVGASCPEDDGDYFAWGETAPKEFYDLSSYKWYSAGEGKLTKYCTDIRYGIADGKTELEPEDDAAYVNWGPLWRMPTTEQQRELVRHCRWKWAKRNGVHGQLVTGPNGKTLFFPATGYRYNDLLIDEDNSKYWSRTFCDTKFACSLYFIEEGPVYSNHSFQRDIGVPVRAVRVSQD